MIDLEKIDSKLKPLNDKILNFHIQFGQDLSDELIKRIEISIASFFDDFKNAASDSFSKYWEKQKTLKIEQVEEIENSKTEDANVPKFISDYKSNKKK